jgi:integrase
VAVNAAGPNVRRRVWLPAVNGGRTRGWAPVASGLHFHDLRHTRETWMIEDEIPEVLQRKRRGHRLRVAHQPADDRRAPRRRDEESRTAHW